MKDMFYWCQLRNGNKHTCGYIEARGAKLGANVELVDLDGEFWTVTSVSDRGVTKDYVRNAERMFKSFGNQEFTDRVERRVAA